MSSATASATTAALSAGLLDFHRERGALVNSVAPIIGMAVGAVGTSALVQFAPAPTHLVFDVLLVAFGLQAVGIAFLPETVTRRTLAWQALRPSIQIPAQARPTLWTVMPLSVAQWALGGFYLSLGPTLASVITGNKPPLIGGALLGVLLLGATLSVLVFRLRPARTALVAGAAALTVGLGLTLLGMHGNSATLFFVGTAIGGVGFGATFNSALRSIVPLAAPHERAGLMSSFFVLSYLAFSLPTVVVGLAVGVFGLLATAIGYGLLLLAFFVSALLMIVRRRGAD